MAGYERKDLQGAAFKNEKKELDWHADYRGDILVDGHDYYVDITKKMSAKGQPYLQVKLKSKASLPPKQRQVQQGRQSESWMTLIYEQGQGIGDGSGVEAFRFPDRDPQSKEKAERARCDRRRDTPAKTRR